MQFFSVHFQFSLGGGWEKRDARDEFPDARSKNGPATNEARRKKQKRKMHENACWHQNRKVPKKWNRKNQQKILKSIGGGNSDSSGCVAPMRFLNATFSKRARNRRKFIWKSNWFSKVFSKVKKLDFSTPRNWCNNFMVFASHFVGPFSYRICYAKSYEKSFLSGFESTTHFSRPKV